MKRFIGRVTAILFAIAVALSVSEQVQAQASRTWISGAGDDANPCSRTSPCQTFSEAISKTAVNGEINCLDPGNFGFFSITKSITIDCHETLGSMIDPGVVGISIVFSSFGAGDVRKTVRLRNLNLNGFGIGANGITIVGSSGSAGGTVMIEDCVIDGHAAPPGRAIDDQRSNGGKLIVTNTTIRNNAGAGISVLPAGGSSNIQVLLNNVRAYNNGTGAQFGNLTRVMIDQSAFDGNAGAGILTVAGAIVSVDRSTITHNANGVQTNGGAISVANSNIQFNTSQAVNNGGGTVVSFGNNRIAFNASAGTAPTPAGAASSDLGQQ